MQFIFYFFVFSNVKCRNKQKNDYRIDDDQVKKGELRAGNFRSALEGEFENDV